MSGRILGPGAVIDDRDITKIKTYLPGLAEGDIPADFRETLGDHVWLPTPEYDEDGVQTNAPLVGLEGQKVPADAFLIVGDSGSTTDLPPEVETGDVGGGGQEAEPVDPWSAEALMEHTVPVLEDVCASFDPPVPHSGTKAEVVANLIDAHDERPDEGTLPD